MRRLTFAITSALVLFYSSTALAQEAKPGPKGEQIYAAQKCSMCHSIAGKGNKAGVLDDVGSRLSEEEIRQWLINPRVMDEKKGTKRKPLMPAYTKLSKDELDALVTYLRSLKKK